MMRKPSASLRAPAQQHSRVARRPVGATVKGVAGGGGLVLLSVLYWLIFYENLPNSLNGMAGNGGAAAADFTTRIVKIGLIVISVLVIMKRSSLARSLARHFNFGAAAFLFLALLSVVWSIDRSATILRFISLASLYLVCFAIAVAGWHRQRFQQLALPPLMVILVASLIVGMILPDRIVELGTDVSQKGAWHGITHGKNEFGMMSSLGAIICVNQWLAAERRSYWAMAGTAAAVTCLFLSRSNTSQLATFVGVMSMVLVMRVPIVKRRFSTHVVVGIAATILLYELVIQDVIPGVHTLMGPIASLTGKDTTFSARTMIWRIVKEHIHYAPYLGTGYGAYWVGPNPSSPSYVFTYLMFFYPTEAHNGYLEVLNDLGILGLIVLLIFIVSYLRQALLVMQTDRSQAALYVAVLYQEMVMDMSESDWFSRSSTFTVLLLAITCLSRAVQEARAQAPAVPQPAVGPSAAAARHPQRVPRRPPRPLR